MFLLALYASAESLAGVLEVAELESGEAYFEHWDSY